MALNKEIWLKGIEEKLWPSNEFYNFSTDHTAIGAIFGKTVHIPNAGTMVGNVIVDPSTFPLTPGTRSDDDLTYALHTFASNPYYVSVTESYELSYPKMQSIILQMTNSINDAVANRAIYDWVYGLTTGSTFASSGTSRAVGNTYQSGTRLAFEFTDILKAHQILNKQNVQANGRKTLCSAQGYYDILNMNKYEHAFIQMGEILENGSLGKLLGADLMMRGSFDVCFNTSSSTFEVVTTATTSATASDFVMIWHPDYVSQCKGSIANAGIQIFEQPNSPQYLSDIVSAAIRHGSSRIRKDDYGVVVVYEHA